MGDIGQKEMSVISADQRMTGGNEMYAVTEGRIKINDKVIRTFERTVLEENTALQVAAGTNGYRGKKRAGGGRTFLRFECFCGDFHFDPVVDEDGEVCGIEIACCGDDALEAVAKALKFLKEAVDEQRFGINR